MPSDGNEFIAEATELSFWVGNWNLMDNHGKRVAAAVITSEHNGFMLHERWQAGKLPSGSSMVFFDPALKKWKQTTVTDTGEVGYYTGEFNNGAMRFEGEFVNADGSRGLRKRRLTPQQDDRVIGVVVQKSLDEGVSWQTEFRGRYEPRKPRLAL